MPRKLSRLLDIDNPEPIQANLFTHPGVTEDLSLWPRIERDEKGFLEVAEEAHREGFMGADLEFSKQGRPTILGVASSKRAASVPWDDGLGRKAFGDSVCKYVGHFILDADRPKIEAQLGIKTNIDQWESTELRHYLLNSDYCSMPGKDEDDEDSTALGLMNIWAMCSLQTSLPNWKFCRGSACYGPCPRHDVFGYNAVDSYGPLVAFYKMRERMEELGIPERLVRDLRDTSLQCSAMTAKGICVDRQYVTYLEKLWEDEKASMFPYELQRKGSREIKQYGYYSDDQWVELPFAPTAPAQILKYFESQGIALKARGGKRAADKVTVRKALEKALKTAGVEYEVSRFGGVELMEGDSLLVKLPDPVQQLYKLDCHKSTGKGLNSWFADNYFQDDKGNRTANELHPRFITTGSALGRLSSSRPNGQNIPKAGKRALVRRCFKPRPGMKLVVSDKSNLEFRVVLYYAGIEVKVPDVFMWLLDRVDGAFDAASKIAGRVPREVAKRVVHACLTPEHEVLTKFGWVRMDAWSDQDIATWDTSGNIVFAKPTAYHRYPFEGSLVSLSGIGISSLCTKNHKFPVLVSGNSEGKYYAKWHRESPTEFHKSGRVPISGVYEGPGISNSDLDIQRTVAIQADATSYGNHRVFHLVKTRKINRLLELFPEAKVTPCKCHPNGFRISMGFSSDLIEGRRFTNKILLMNPRQREVFLTEIPKWDGTCNEARKSQHYFTNDLENAKLVQTLVHLSGKQALIRIDHGSGFNPEAVVYKVSFNARKYSQICKSEIKEHEYKGDVYCFTVSSGYFLVRHNDTISVTGNSDLLEGAKVFYDRDLRSTTVQREIKDGALILYDGKQRPKWEVRGGLVGFTGSNLAESLFKVRTNEARKAALEIQEKFFANFPEIREWHRSLSRFVDRGYVQTKSGRYLELYGSAEDDLKLAAAMFMQGGGADEVQEAMRRFWYRGGEHDVPLLQIHDELVFEVPADWTDDRVLQFMEPFHESSQLFDGRIFPVEISVGSSWFGGIKLGGGKYYMDDPGDRRTIWEKGARVY